MQAPEIKRVSGATQVEQASKGWSPTGNADEWKNRCTADGLTEPTVAPWLDRGFTLVVGAWSWAD
jgi:hypothetical protein